MYGNILEIGVKMPKLSCESERLMDEAEEALPLQIFCGHPWWSSKDIVSLAFRQLKTYS